MGWKKKLIKSLINFNNNASKFCKNHDIFDIHPLFSKMSTYKYLPNTNNKYRPNTNMKEKHIAFRIKLNKTNCLNLFGVFFFSAHVRKLEII